MIDVTVKLTDEEAACFQAEADRRGVPAEAIMAMALAAYAYDRLGLGARLAT